MSSAKRTKFNNDELLGRSLTYIKNNKGPSMDPCGTPHLISKRVELYGLIETNCFLLLR